MIDEHRAIRTARECMTDLMTGLWAELRDMAREDHIARMVLDGVLHSPRDAEDVLLHAVVHLLRDNARLRQHALQILMTTPAPSIASLVGARTGESNAHD